MYNTGKLVLGHCQSHCAFTCRHNCLTHDHVGIQVLPFSDDMMMITHSQGLGLVFFR